MQEFKLCKIKFTNIKNNNIIYLHKKSVKQKDVSNSINDLCFEIIHKCTNYCEFCSSYSSMKADNIIEYELFKKVIDYIMINGGVKEISISGGEPFLHKNLTKMVKLCKEYGVQTNLYTSGIIENQLRNIDIYKYNYSDRKILENLKKLEFSCIDKEKLNELKKIGLDKIVFDFKSAENESYNMLMGTKRNIVNLMQSMINAKG